MRGAAIWSGAVFLLSAAVVAQDLAVARAAAKIDTAIAWISDGFYPNDPGRPVARLPKTGVDRDALLDQALKRARDEKKLVLWYIPRIEGGHMVRPEILDGYMRVVAFTDPGLTALIDARFVPLRMAVDGGISQRTGIKKLDWVEPAIAILGPDGAMLHRLDRIRTFNPAFFERTLIGVLDRHPGLAPPPEGLTASVDEAAADPARDMQQTQIAAAYAATVGYLSGAERIARACLVAPAVGESARAWAHQTLASITWDPGEAASHLDAADRLEGGDHSKWALLSARGYLALATGDAAAARTAFADAAGLKDNPARASALYSLAIARALTRDEAGAEETFRQLVAEYTDDEFGWPFAAMAASNLIRAQDSTPLGPAFHSFLDPLAPLPDAFAESRTTSACSRPVEQRDATVRRAVAFLLRHQNGNGGFQDSRYAFCDSPRILPNVWVAVTAIALAGLDDWREVDPKAIDEAIARGEEYLFDPASMARGHNEECYADTFRLLYLVRRLPRLPSVEAARARARLNEVAKRLVEQQSERGFWAHEYPNPFAAAAALLALDYARQAGAAVPESVFERGAGALRSTRGEGGTFAYGAGRPARRESDEVFKNAMARMPVCERALLAPGGAPDTAALEASLDNFWKHLPRIERIRTCDFHSDGELGGFFFWHGMFLTSESIKALPQEKRAAHDRKMLEHVMSIPEIDGSFVDSHELGKSYGTGMALMVLRNSVPKAP